MTEQFSLAGFDVPAPPPRQPMTDRLFTALMPDPDTAARITQIAQQLRTDHALRGRLVATERLHVTLNHLGDFPAFPAELADRAIKAMAALPPMAAFDVAFDRAMSFTNRRASNLPFVLRASSGVEAMTTLAKALETAMIKAGAMQKRATFTPHVTLLYDDRSVAETPVEPVRWTAREFVLMHSLLGQTKHVALARFSLAG